MEMPGSSISFLAWSVTHSLLRHGLPIVVKKGKKNNIAVMRLGAWEAEQAVE